MKVFQESNGDTESSGVGKRPATEPFGIKFRGWPIDEAGATAQQQTGRLHGLRPRTPRFKAGNTLNKVKTLPRHGSATQYLWWAASLVSTFQKYRVVSYGNRHRPLNLLSLLYHSAK